MQNNRLADLTVEKALLDDASMAVRWAMAEASGLDSAGVREEFHARGGRMKHATKSATDAIGFDDIDLSRERRAVAELAERFSVLGQIQGATRVGLAVAARDVVGSPTAGWLGQAAPAPVSSFTFNGRDLDPLKLIGTVVTTRELIRRRDVQAANLLQRGLVSALGAATDTALLDPNSTAISDVRPASLTAGLNAVVSNANVGTCAGAALNAISDGAPARPHLFLSFTQALKVPSLIRDLRELGVVVIITPAAGARTIALDASRLIVAAGDIEISSSSVADIEMDTAPSGATRTSMFVTNQVAFRALRIMNWFAGSGSVAYSTVS